MSDINQAQLRYLATDDVHALSSDAVIDTQRKAFIALADGTGQLGVRVLLPGSDGSVVFSYAARLSPTGAPVTKFGSVVPTNAGRGLPAVSAIVVALDPVTGRPLAIADGEAVTEARTVAASMLAAQTLANAARTVTVLGTGRQGRLHATAAARTLRATKVRIWSPFDPAAMRFAADLEAETDATVEYVESAADAVAGSDLVLACTTSKTPILEAAWLSPGTTVISIGSFAADRCEVGPDLVTSARLVVDHRSTAAAQGGPIVQALREDRIVLDDLVEIGDVLIGTAAGRTSAREIVYYNSVGVGIQDAAVIDALLAAGPSGGPR